MTQKPADLTAAASQLHEKATDYLSLIIGLGLIMAGGLTAVLMTEGRLPVIPGIGLAAAAAAAIGIGYTIWVLRGIASRGQQ